jgi:CRISPR/Cas system-associated exonuclease Cas4 (RecB family)
MVGQNELCRIGEEAVYEAFYRYWRHEDRTNEVHVTDLCGYCMRQTYLQKKHPELFKMETMFRMLTGTKLHEIPLFPHIPDSHEIKLDGLGVKGTMDEYAYGIIYDKKVSFSEHTAAADYVKKQLNYYAVLARERGMEVRGAVVLYINPELGKVKSFEVKLGPHDMMMAELIDGASKMQNYLNTGLTPPRETGWWCAGCGAACLCFTAGAPQAPLDPEDVA